MNCKEEILLITVFMRKLKYEASSFCSSVLHSTKNAEGKQKKKWCSVKKHSIIHNSYLWQVKCSWACQGPKSASNLIYPNWCLCSVSTDEFQHRKWWCDSLPNVDNRCYQSNFTWQCSWVVYNVLFFWCAYMSWTVLTLKLEAASPSKISVAVDRASFLIRLEYLKFQSMKWDSLCLHAQGQYFQYHLCSNYKVVEMLGQALQQPLHFKIL